jgi:ureidoglycolate lyase
MKPRLLKPVPLTAERFAPYGDVVAPEQAMEVRHINYGNTDRFHNLANLDLPKDGGKPLVSIFRSRPLPRPISIKVLERHPLSSQAFFPLSNRHYLVVVAEKGA